MFTRSGPAFFGSPQSSAGGTSYPRAFDYWTVQEVAAAARAPLANVITSWRNLCQAMADWGVDSPLCMIGLVGTIAKESGSFLPVEEAYWLPEAARWAYYADTSKHAAYQGGPQFHGIGFIQTTHLGGYQDVQNALASHGVNVNLVAHPEYLLDPYYAAQAAAIFWAKKGLAPLCEQQNWTEIRRRVWGAYGDTDGVGKLQYAASYLLPRVGR